MKHLDPNVMFTWIVVFCLVAGTNPAAFAQQNKSSETTEVEKIVQINDPVQRLAALRAFATKYPNSSELPRVRSLTLHTLLVTAGPSDELIKACELAFTPIPKSWKAPT